MDRDQQRGGGGRASAIIPLLCLAAQGLGVRAGREADEGLFTRGLGVGAEEGLVTAAEQVWRRVEAELLVTGTDAVVPTAEGEEDRWACLGQCCHGTEWPGGELGGPFGGTTDPSRVPSGEAGGKECNPGGDQQVSPAATADEGRAPGAGGRDEPVRPRGISVAAVHRAGTVQAQVVDTGHSPEVREAGDAGTVGYPQTNRSHDPRGPLGLERDFAELVNSRLKGEVIAGLKEPRREVCAAAAELLRHGRMDLLEVGAPRSSTLTGSVRRQGSTASFFVLA